MRKQNRHNMGLFDDLVSSVYDNINFWKIHRIDYTWFNLWKCLSWNPITDLESYRVIGVQCFSFWPLILTWDFKLFLWMIQNLKVSQLNWAFLKILYFLLLFLIHLNDLHVLNNLATNALKSHIPWRDLLPKSLRDDNSPIRVLLNSFVTEIIDCSKYRSVLILDST